MHAQYVTSADASKRALKFLNDGINYAMAGRLDDAISQFLSAVETEPAFLDAWMDLGDAYMQDHDDSLAVEAYRKVLDLNPDAPTWLYLKLAQVEMNTGLYDDAQEHVNYFLADPDMTGEPRSKAELLKKNIDFAAVAVKHPVPFHPVNMGDSVNSDYPEYFPSLSVDGNTLVMTRRIKDKKEVGYGVYRDFENENFFICYKSDSGWTQAVDIGPPVNTPLNEGAQTISADGRMLFYTLCDAPLGYGSCDIYFTMKIGDSWTDPINLGPPMNTGDWESQPSVSADGRQLFFSSQRPGGLGSYDIWMSESDGKGGWTKPVNLGPKINTPYSEQCPFIHPDGKTLYFSSDGHPGMGGSDLFYSRLQDDGTWGDPVNIGYPVNSKDNEISLSVSADGKSAYYASDRGKTKGDMDIYTFLLPKEAEAEPVSYVKAIVTDSKTGRPLKASVQLLDIATGTSITTSTSDPTTGEFLIVLPIGKDYGLYVQKNGYFFHSENFSLRDAIPQKPFIIQVSLQPMEAGDVITLKNIFFKTGSAELLPASITELNKVLDMMNSHPDMQIQVNGHTDNVGTESSNMTLSNARAQSVKKFLTDNGISDARIRCKGFGESRPIDTNDTEEGRANNRRTEILIISM